MLDWLRKALRPGADEGAVAHSAYDAGDWQRAVTLLQPLARERPDDARVHYRLGDALYRLERPQEALAPLERAVRIAGNVAVHHYKLGNALMDLERLDDALACYRRVLELEPRHAQALNNTGTILETKGNLDEALRHYRQSIHADGALLSPHNNLAMLLHRMDRFAEAVDAYQALLRVAPGSEEIWCNLGNVYIGLERFNDSVQCYERALECRPDSALAFYRLGIALSLLGKYQEAEAAARRVVELVPEHVDGWISLGDILQTRLRFDDALAAYQRGLDLDAHRPELLNNIGTAHKGKRSLETALKFFKQAIENAPNNTLARMNLIGVHLVLGEVAETVAGYRDLLKTDPRHEQAARQLLLALLYQPVSAEELFAEHLAYGSRFGSGQHATKPREMSDGAARKIRIGYVSSDFRRHPVGYNLAPIIQSHDRSSFEVYLYSHLKQPDDMTLRFQEHADVWHSITYLSDQAVAKLMREDRLDILVLLAGRFDENRPLLAIHRPAPIQVSMHDPATSGLREIDYLIADRNLVPRNTTEKFTERVACLPTFFLHPPLDNAPGLSEPPSARNGHITFGSFNNPAKISGDVVALWAQVLHRVPGSRLLLKHFDVFMISSIRSRFVELFRKNGITEDRLLLSDQKLDLRERHLARYAEIDIALDTFPFAGSTTTFEALWMGVPVVTLEGARMVARWSTAMLRKAGQPHLVARDEAHYVEIARELASNPGELARLRRELRERVARSPLCAVQARTRQLERLYRRMWAIHHAARTGH